MLWDILCRPFMLLWVTFIGIVIGVLPAIGGSAANIMAYDQAKKFSKRPEKFGTGIPEGIVASEASNSANVAGSLMMIMAFGIPGDAVTAVMMGALTIHGIQPGPLFISQHPKIAYGIYAAYLVALPLMIAVIWIGSRAWLRIIMMPKSMLIPIVLVLCVIGAYALSNSMNDVYVLALFCVIGYAMVKARIPLAPLILGVVLGDQIEANLIQAISTDADPWLFVTRPISGGLLAASVLSVARRRLAAQPRDQARRHRRGRGRRHRLLTALGRQRVQNARPGADALVEAFEVELLVRRMHAVVVEREADQQRIHAEHALEVGDDRDRAAGADRHRLACPTPRASTLRALLSAGLSKDSCSGGARPKLANSTLQSAGMRARTKARNASQIFSGSCSPTSRNETLAVASPGMTVLAPSPV